MTPGHQRPRSLLEDCPEGVAPRGCAQGLSGLAHPRRKRRASLPSTIGRQRSPCTSPMRSASSQRHAIASPPRRCPKGPLVPLWFLNGNSESLTGPRNTCPSPRIIHKSRARFGVLISRLTQGCRCPGALWGPKVCAGHRGRGHRGPDMAPGAKEPFLPSSASPLSSHPQSEAGRETDRLPRRK